VGGGEWGRFDRFDRFDRLNGLNGLNDLSGQVARPELVDGRALSLSMGARYPLPTIRYSLSTNHYFPTPHLRSLLLVLNSPSRLPCPQCPN
jgi:hypothetical protein